MKKKEKVLTEHQIELEKEVKKHHKFHTVVVNEAGSTITGHCGPGTFGILYFRKENI